VAVILPEDPNHYDAYRTKGLCLLRTRPCRGRLPCFSTSSEGEPRTARADVEGEANEALGRNAEAFASFDSAIDAVRIFGGAWRDKGLLHVKVEQFPPPQTPSPRDGRSSDRQALWYMRAFRRAGREFDAAVQSYDEALRLDARGQGHLEQQRPRLVQPEAVRRRAPFSWSTRRLALDPAYEPAQSARKSRRTASTGENRGPRGVPSVRFEKHLSRPATRDEVSVIGSVPVELLDEVIATSTSPLP